MLHKVVYIRWAIMIYTVSDDEYGMIGSVLSKPRYIQDGISWTENAATLLIFLVQIAKDWRFLKM